MKKYGAMTLISLLFLGSTVTGEMSHTVLSERTLPTQFRPPHHEDVTPVNCKDQELDAYTLGVQAVVYGYPGVYQYIEMYKQAIDKNEPAYVGFNKFKHDRELAGPDYVSFKSPNSDTLYSNAWLNLSDGPLVFHIPATGGRYYTAQILDAYSNSANIGKREYGSEETEVLLIPPGWKGEIPKGIKSFYTATPYIWVLLRILVDDKSEYQAVHTLQDQFTFTPLATYLDPHIEIKATTRHYTPNKLKDVFDYFRIMDFVWRANGNPSSEDALITQFRRVGLFGREVFGVSKLSDCAQSALRRAYEEANGMISRGMPLIGRLCNHWRSGDVGIYGANYLHRAVTNFVGLGGNVIEEYDGYITSVDQDGERLDGHSRYRLHFKTTPPVNAFWSVTLYRLPSRTLYPNKIDRYLISDRSKGITHGNDGSLDIYIQHEKPAGMVSNWLPAPAGFFYIVIRCYLPKDEVMTGTWKPPLLEKN